MALDEHMTIKNISFDAVITDSNGKKLEAECRISEPPSSGLPADISIEIPLMGEEITSFENPCILHSINSSYDIEVQDLWYRSMPAGRTRRKHERGTFKIEHAGQLSIRSHHCKSNLPRLRFNLSPIRFFQEHLNAIVVNYSNLPSMELELFKLNTTELGDIRFIKHWYIHHIEKKDITAEIHASFAVEVNCAGTMKTCITEISNQIRDILIPLSILTRQAITLHGWEWCKSDGTETTWIYPLNPNLAPDMAIEPILDLCIEKEFQSQAQNMVEKFLASNAEIKEAVTLLSAALSPHLEKTTSANFFALFSVLEQVVSIEKLTKEDKKKLHETDYALISALLKLKLDIQGENRTHAEILTARIDGLISKVKNPSPPSFMVRLKKFQNTYPHFNRYTSDLWPISGNEKKPGLKQIRDLLAHQLRKGHNAQAIAVAHWHLARLAERLAFILLDTEVPKGIEINSPTLAREGWYNRMYWLSVQEKAQTNPTS